MEQNKSSYEVRDIAIALCNGEVDEIKIRELGKNKIRPRLRDIYPEQAPGTGGRWELTYEQALGEVTYWRNQI